MTRRKFLTLTAATAATGAAGLALAGSNQVRLTRHQVSWPCPRGIRVAHLTDLHVGWGTPAHLLRQAVELTRRARPHLVVLTGDYLNHSLKRLPALKRFVRALPRPCVATLGNHDHWSGPGDIRYALERLGVTVLRNENVTIDVAGQRLQLVGVDDGMTGHHDIARAFRGVRHPKRALVLSHYGETADEIVEAGGRLVLSGHTHGGQLQIPILTRAVTAAAGMRYIAGWYKVGPGRVYVSAGIGSSVIRRRVGRRAEPEVALLDLV